MDSLAAGIAPPSYGEGGGVPAAIQRRDSRPVAVSRGPLRPRGVRRRSESCSASLGLGVRLPSDRVFAIRRTACSASLGILIQNQLPVLGRKRLVAVLTNPMRVGVPHGRKHLRQLPGHAAEVRLHVPLKRNELAVQEPDHRAVLRVQIAKDVRLRIRSGLEQQTQ